MIELLAPAKDKNCAMAAIDFGADAVYIGASDFGARKNVPNSLSDIKEIVEYAHKFNVKVYVTINTILKDDEILKAKELVEKLTEINVDAIIIQDMGLVEILKGTSAVLHASTQCDNRSAEKVKFLESVGFSRVILARELSVEEIKKIKSKTNVELEAFVHGALCVSYSGQCYLSQMIGGRSANRGECAQPCRKKYSLVNEKGDFIAKDKHLLSLKDFNASKNIKELAEAGVTSFKIEGRLKDENYVKNVVGYYRKLIDSLNLKKSSSGKVCLDFEPDLKKSFNRGFTNYFLDGKRSEIYSFSSPKAMGEYLGKVTKTGKDFFEVSTNSIISAQDGLCFTTGEGLSGCLVNKAEKNRIYPNKMTGIKIGLDIYRNFDSAFEKQLKNSKTTRKIWVNIEFNLGKIKAVDEDKNTAEISYEFEELAQNKEKMEENVKSQLKKSGESCFSIQNVKIKTDKIPFLPVSKINELRRELLEKLEDERLKNYKKTTPATASSHLSYPQTEIDYLGNVMNQWAKNFYQEHGCKVSEMAIEHESSANKPNAGKKAMSTKHCLKYALKKCKSPEKFYLIDEKGKKYPLKFDCKNCQMEVYFGKEQNKNE